jgi:hypothetical protein
LLQIPRVLCFATVGRGRVRCASVTPYRIEGNSAGLGIPVALYLTVLGLLALWFYSLFQPQYIHNRAPRTMTSSWDDRERAQISEHFHS